MDARIGLVIDSLPELRGQDVRVEPLPGGLTNRNYALKAGEQRFVLRLAGENSEFLGIDRATEHASARAAFQLGIAPEVIAFFPDQQALVTRYVSGTVLSSETMRAPDTLEKIVASLRSFHDGPGGGGNFSVFETIRRYYSLARQRGVALPAEVGRALETLAKIESAVGVPARVAPCHNDLLAANFLQDENRIWILDWEYAGVGDVFFDLANLAASNGFDDADEQLLLQFYFGEALPADLARLRLLRLASDLREAMWGFVQLGISRLNFDYREYALLHLQRFLAAATVPSLGP